tara:strand:+ start:764 stop:1246 length:483 start_codon:yes stop_codon:yes gene_type:complete
MAENTIDCGSNFLEPSGFKILINRQNLPNLEFYAQSIQHPDVDMPVTEISYPRVGKVGVVGESVNFGMLTIDVILDEKMLSYREVYDWMLSAINSEHKLTPASYFDMTLSILTSNNTPNREFKYINAFPTNVGAIPFSAMNSGEYISFPVTFRFDYFEFI